MLYAKCRFAIVATSSFDDALMFLKGVNHDLFKEDVKERKGQKIALAYNY